MALYCPFTLALGETEADAAQMIRQGELAGQRLDESIEALAVSPMSVGLYGGFPGIAWTAEHLGRRVRAEPDGEETAATPETAETPETPEDDEDDDVNAEIDARWAALPMSELRERFATVPGQLRGYLTVVPESRWLKHPDHQRFFLDETTAHYEGHEADLKAILAAAGR